MARMESQMCLIGLILCLLACPVTLAADDAGHAVVQDVRDRALNPPNRTLIYDGIDTGEYPATAQLLYGSSVHDAFGSCSATLIGCDTVLTAAHCVCPEMVDCGNPENVIPPESLFVYLQNAGTVAVSEVHAHPEARVPGPDIAVLKLAEPVTGVTPARINEVAPLGIGTVGTIVGFGYSNSRRGDFGTKRFGQIETIGCDALNSVGSGVTFTDEESICWYYEGSGNAGEDSNNCFGDSGGSLYATVASDGGPRLVLAGVTSGGFGCLAPSWAFDVNVYQYRDFILNAAGGALGTDACGDLPAVGSPRTKTVTMGGTISLQQPAVTKVVKIDPGARKVRFTINGDDGYGGKSIVFYVKRGNEPTVDDYDCAWTSFSNYGLCEIESPLPGNWYVRVQGQQDYMGGIVDHSAFQVSATVFDIPESAGRASVSVEPLATAIAPGGRLYYSFTVKNLSQESLPCGVTYKFISPTGKERIFGPQPVMLGPGGEYVKTGRLTVTGENALGFWTMVVEAASETGTDGGWNSFEVQTERATKVRLTTNEATAKQGGTWPFLIELENVTGRRQMTSMSVITTDPSGDVQASDPQVIHLEPGKPWSRHMFVGHNFSETDAGEWKVVVEAVTGDRVDREEIRFVVIGVGNASIRVIDWALTAAAVTSDGRAVVGQAWTDDYIGNYIWTAEGGLELIEGGWSTAGPIGISDDRSKVVGHLVDSFSGLEFAAIWSRDTRTWDYLPLYNNDIPMTCGLSLSAAYDMAADGSRVVGLAYDTDCDAHAFQWTPETGTTLLPRSVADQSARANVISADGSVIGGWDAYAETGARRAAMWVADEPGNPATTWSQTLLGSLQPDDPVNGMGEVYAMNDSGTRLYGESPGEDRGVMFIWTAANGIGLLAGAPAPLYQTYPAGASEDGKVIIGGFGPMMSWYREAFIITPDRGWMRLSDYLRERGVDISAVGLDYLNYATAITPDGKTIIGHNWAEGQAWIVTLGD